MKMVVAIVRPDKINAVLEALFRVQVRGAHHQPRAGTRG